MRRRTVGMVCQCGRCSRCLVAKLVWVYGETDCDMELTRYFWSEMQDALRTRGVVCEYVW